MLIIMYDVTQIAKALNVSKVTIYSKLKLEEVKPYITVKNGKSFVNEEGLEVIRQTLKYTPADSDTSEENDISVTLEEVETLKENFIDSLKSQLDSLNSQLEFLKSQLQNKDEQLQNKDELLRNMQVLLKQDQENRNRLLIEQENERDIRLVNALTEKLEQHKQEIEEERRNKKGFFNFFKHK